MAKTPVSSLTSYASAADLLNAHSASKIGSWAADTANAQPTPLTPAQILTSSVVAAALLRASGDLELACFRGERYTPLDLAALTGASAAAMKGLVCDRAFYYLACRYMPSVEAAKVTGDEKVALTIQALNDGAIIFGLQEAADAGNPSSIDLMYDSRGERKRMTETFGRLFGRREGDDRIGGRRGWSYNGDG